MANASKPRSASKGSSKGAKRASPAKKQPAAKARKPAKAMGKPKAAKAKPKAAPKARKPASTRVERSAMPEHAASKAARRRAVARPTKAHHEVQMEKAEHDHQDPRLAGI